MKIEDKYFKEFTLKIEDVDVNVLNESIYNQLARNIAKLADIDFAKTPVVDLFTGYQRGLVLQQRIDEAIEYIENHSLYEEEYDYDYEENIYLSGINDETTKKDLLEILKGSENDE